MLPPVCIHDNTDLFSGTLDNYFNIAYIKLNSFFLPRNITGTYFDIIRNMHIIKVYIKASRAEIM